MVNVPCTFYLQTRREENARGDHFQQTCSCLFEMTGKILCLNSGDFSINFWKKNPAFAWMQIVNFHKYLSEYHSHETTIVNKLCKWPLQCVNVHPFSSPRTDNQEIQQDLPPNKTSHRSDISILLDKNPDKTAVLCSFAHSWPGKSSQTKEKQPWRF